MPQKRDYKGSKEEVRPGVWYIRVSCGYKRDGTRRTKRETVHGTERDAAMAIMRLGSEMEACVSIGDEPTLGEYFWLVFLPLKQSTTTKANANTYKHIFRNHIEPTFGDVDITEIDNIAIQRWINTLPAQSAPAYVRTMRAVMNQAAFDHVIPSSPMRDYGYRLPKGRKTQPLPVWTPQEVGECLKRLQGHPLFPLWCCMTGCGLSRSEALALDWENIAFAEITAIDGEPHWTALVDVHGACTAEDGMKETKNSRRERTVPMQPLFADALHPYMDEGPICKSYHGTRLTPDYVPKKWKKLFEDGQPLHGMRFVHINRMRATYLTMMQQAGVDATIINAIQGREENSEVLYTNYLNPHLDIYASAAARMENVIRAATP